jgi:hypothetical protein
MGRERIVRASGLAAVAVYSACIVWLYVRQPQNIEEVTGSMAAGIGAYRIDQQAFDDGLRFFRQEQFAAARAAFDRGRLYIDAESFRHGLDHVNKAIALAPGGRLRLDDANLQMRSADELKAELEAGLRREAADFNPLKVFRRRK